MTKLLIVESPGKIKKLKAILGPGWEVKASVGHIRQLSNQGEDALGFEMREGAIQCTYVPRDSRAKETIAHLKSAASRSHQVYLASDPDREGETIAWHIAQVLNLKQPQRVVYQEITESAVRRAIASPRPLNQDLVNAGRCRDCLDKLVGYKGSPLVWRLNNGAKSVGRVQSATLHIVCEREREILAFQPVDYWSVFVNYSEGFRAFYSGSETAEKEDDAIDDTGLKEKSQESTRVLSEEEANRLIAIAQTHPHQVVDVQGKLTSKKPPAPFTTSALQQVAGSRIKFSPEKTMQVAQKLYEAGLITYMRTDSVQLSPEFCEAAKQWLQTNDPANVPKKVSTQRTKTSAQEGHEAIRPTDVTLSSAALKPTLSEDEFKLYVLIWMRAIASQCKPAKSRKSVILSRSGSVNWRVTGQVVEFEGYAKYWKDLNGDKVLPKVSTGQALSLKLAAHEKKQTKPPARYTEPKLVQVMEKKGIGRPSTYAPTVKTLKTREYVELAKGRWVTPTERGMQVDEFLGRTLPELIEAKFTAQMEASLDAIAHSQAEWQRYLIDWHEGYFKPALSQASKGLPEQTGSGSNRELDKSRTKCPSCGERMSKVPTKKVKKKYFLMCEVGCQAEDGRNLVMFWSARSKQWALPGARGTDSGTTAITQHRCPVCQQELEQYNYVKDGQQKRLLRCSDANARGNKKHKDVVYFFSQGRWWSPKFGELQDTEAQSSG